MDSGDSWTPFPHVKSTVAYLMSSMINKMSCKHSFCQKWFPNMIFQVLHLKWLPNVFELWKLVHREAPEVHFFLTPGVGRLSVQLRQHNKLLCLILEAGKKCCSGSLVWVNLNNSNESDLHSWWGTWFCMLEMRSSQRLILLYTIAFIPTSSLSAL